MSKPTIVMQVIILSRYKTLADTSEVSGISRCKTPVGPVREGGFERRV